MECCDRFVVGEVNQWGRPRRVHAGVMTCTTRAHHGLVLGSRRRVRGVWPGGCGRGHAAETAVAQPVEHQLGQLAGGGDHTDVATPAGGDPVADLAEPGVSTNALHGLDRGPPDQAAALFICGNPERQLAGCPLILFLFLDLLGGG
jgi:hypothetical protein